MSNLETIADEIIAEIQDDPDYFKRCPLGRCGDFKYNMLLPLLRKLVAQEKI